MQCPMCDHEDFWATISYVQMIMPVRCSSCQKTTECYYYHDRERPRFGQKMYCEKCLPGHGAKEYDEICQSYPTMFHTKKRKGLLTKSARK